MKRGERALQGGFEPSGRLMQSAYLSNLSKICDVLDGFARVTCMAPLYLLAAYTFIVLVSGGQPDLWTREDVFRGVQDPK